jgi:hypothetical protein
MIAPGAKARLYGTNLDKVKNLVIGGKTIPVDAFVAAEDQSYIEYVVPADLAEADHRVVLVDAAGNEYGGNVVKATKLALITRELVERMLTESGP